MSYEDAAKKLAELYGEEFGGKSSGRYRIPQKLLRELLGKKRIYEADISALTKAVFEEGFVLIDMDSFYVVMNANSFVNYRRVAKDDLN
ncbi:MAG: hypothetical protein JJ902_01600 [Roseibium sp.]|nr:hypothetical protein [Roseibium sp.]